MENRFFDLLPKYLKTQVNRKTSAVTADVLFEPENSEQILGQVGDVSGASQADLARTPQIHEPDPDRRAHQLSVAAVLGIDGSIESASFLSDLIGHVSANGGLVSDQSRLFDTGYWVWNPPIDADRWTNFHRYVWLGPGAARTSAEYVTKDPEGSRVVLHRVDGPSSFTAVDITVSSVAHGSFPAGTTVGQLREDGTTVDRTIYRWNGSAWTVATWVPVSDLPETTSAPAGTYLYVARAGHLYQRPMVSTYSTTSRRWVPGIVSVGVEAPESPVDGMVWEDCSLPPKRRLMRYSSTASTWSLAGTVPAATLTGLGLRTSADVVYHAFSASSVSDGWKINNWWFHFDDLSPVDRAAVTSESFGVRPILQFWGGLESYLGDTRSARHDEPRFNVYARLPVTGEVEKITVSDFGTNTVDEELGNRIISFRRGAGRDDPIMGFPLSLDNGAEIVFDVDLTSRPIETELFGELAGYRFFRDVHTGQNRSVWTRGQVRLPHDPVDGVYGIPRALSNNPDHGDLASFTRSDVLHHMVSGLMASSGDPTGSNGSRWSGRSIETSMEIIDPDASPLKAMALVASPETDLAESIRIMANETARFHRKFAAKLEELWDTGTYSTPQGTLIGTAEDLCDTVLSSVLAARIDGSPFWTSGMGTYEDPDMGTRPIAVPPSPARVGAGPAFEPGYRDGQLLGHDGRTIPSYGDERDLVWLELEQRFFDEVPDEFKVETSTRTTLSTRPWNHLEEVGRWDEPTTVDRVDEIVDDFTAIVTPSDGDRVFSRVHGAFADRVSGTWSLTQAIPDDVFVNDDDGLRYVFNGLDAFVITSYPRPHNHAYSWQDLSALTAREFERWAVARGKTLADNPGYSQSDRFTWNYSSAGVEGGWRGIYRRIYGTWSPHSRPWETCGFRVEPDWWRTTYVPTSTAPDGSPRYGSAHPMWDDIRSGLTSAPVIVPSWALPSAMVLTPVDSDGELLDPIAAGIVELGAVDPTRVADGFRFGDVSDVEAEFWGSPEGTFSVALASYLMRPSRFVEALWNESTVSLVGTIDSPTPVDSVTIKRARIADAASHGGEDSNPGILGWIAEALLLRGASPTDVLFDQVRTGRPQSAWRAGGFLSQDRFQATLVGGTPIPNEDSVVDIYRSGPTRTLFHGGVVIQRVGPTYRLYGYDWARSSFPASTGIRPSIGGFVVFSQDFVSDGTGVFTLTDFEVKDNDTGRFAVISGGLRVEDRHVTIVDSTTVLVNPAPQAGVSVSIKLEAPQGQEITRERYFTTPDGRRFGWLPTPSGQTVEYPYGHAFQGAQEVVDFLVDHGRYQTSQGWRYDDPDSPTENDWLAVAKRFAEWTATASDGSIFADVAGGRYLRLELDHGSVMDMVTPSLGTSPASDMGGFPIRTPELSVMRIGGTTEIRSSDREVFSVRARVYTVEHAVFFSSSTRFNDLVYSPVTGLRHPRIVVSGLRTKSWNGRMESPGHVILGGSLLPNFEKLASDSSRVYDRTRPNDSEVRRRLAFGLYGWWPRPHVEGLGVLPTSSFDFHRGAIRKKGTTEAMKAFLNGTTTGLSATNISENWCWRVAEIGGIENRDFCRFTVEEIDVRDKLQIVRFADEDEVNDGTIEILPKSINDDRWLYPPKGDNMRFPENAGLDMATRAYTLLHIGDDEEIVRRYWHWDPAAGLHEPRARAQVDLVSPRDPARYTNGLEGDRAPGMEWGASRVGTIWWDTSNLSYSDYRSVEPLRARGDAWGSLSSNRIALQQMATGTIVITTELDHGFTAGDRVLLWSDGGRTHEAAVIDVADSDTFEAVVRFDGSPQVGVLDTLDVPMFNAVSASDVEVYEWIESDVPPRDHASDDGRVRSASDPSWTEVLVDGSFKYYYWVRWRTEPARGKSMSALLIESSLRDPTRYGGGWFAPISTDAMVLDVSGDSFDGRHSLEVRIEPLGVRTHQEWTLVREGHEISTVPDPVIESLLSGLLEVDHVGNPVPHPGLIASERYGTGRGQTVFRDAARARKAFVSGLNRAMSRVKMVDSVDFSVVFPVADEGTWWSAAPWIDADLDGIEVTQSVRTISDRDTIRLPMDGDWIRITEAITDPIFGGPRTASATFRREDGEWVQHGASSSTASVTEDIFDLDDPREVILSILGIMDPTVASEVVFYSLYEMLAQGPCDWFFKTSLIDVSHGITVSNPAYKPRDEIPLVESAVSELKPYHTKVRDLQVIATTDVDESDMSVVDTDEKRIVEFVDRLSSNLGDEHGFDSSPFDAQPFDLQPLYMRALGTEEWSDLASFQIVPGQGTYVIDARPSSEVALRLVTDTGVPALHVITRLGDGTVRIVFDAAPPTGPTYTLQQAMAFTTDAQAWPLDPDFAEIERTHDHYAYRIQPTVDGIHNDRTVVGSPDPQASAEDGGDMEERARTASPDHAVIDVATDFTVAMSGFDSTPFESTPFDYASEQAPTGFSIVTRPELPGGSGFSVVLNTSTSVTTTLATERSRSVAVDPIYEIGKVLVNVGYGLVELEAGADYELLSGFSFSLLRRPPFTTYEPGTEFEVGFPIGQVRRGSSPLVEGVDYDLEDSGTTLLLYTENGGAEPLTADPADLALAGTSIVVVHSAAKIGDGSIVRVVENRLAAANDPASGSWTKSSVSAITGTLVRPSAFGTGLGAGSVTDANAGVTGYISQQLVSGTYPGEILYSGVCVGKGSSANLALEMIFTGAETVTARAVVNPSTGAITGSLGDARVFDMGDFWLVTLVSRNSVEVGNDDVELRFYPAYCALGSGSSSAAAATGTQVVYGFHLTRADLGIPAYFQDFGLSPTAADFVALPGKRIGFPDLPVGQRFGVFYPKRRDNLETSTVINPIGSVLALDDVVDDRTTYYSGGISPTEDGDVILDTSDDNIYLRSGGSWVLQRSSVEGRRYLSRRELLVWTRTGGVWSSESVFQDDGTVVGPVIRAVDGYGLDANYWLGCGHDTYTLHPDHVLSALPPIQADPDTIVGWWGARTARIDTTSGHVVILRDPFTGADLVNASPSAGCVWSMPGSDPRAARLQFASGTPARLSSAVSSLDNVWTGDGNLVVVLTPGTSTGSAQTVAEKRSGGGWSLKTGTNGTDLVFAVDFSGTDGIWTVSAALTVGSKAVVDVAYNSSSSSNSPTIYVNGILQTLTVTSAPVGTAVTDAPSDLAIGASAALADPFNGRFHELVLLAAAPGSGDRAAFRSVMAERWSA